MLTEKQISDAAIFLTDLCLSQSRCNELPKQASPMTRHDAYRIQAKANANPVVAWKIAATSVAGQKHIGVDGPLLGRYSADRVVASGGKIPFGKNHMKVAEVEFCFRLGRDIVPLIDPYTEEEIFEAVTSLHPAIEIPDSRYNDFAKVGAAQLIADNACANWLAIGDALSSNWRERYLADYKPVGRITGKSETEGKGSNVLGSPRTAMTWAINELSREGITAKAGEYVSTGTCILPMAIAPGDQIEGDFGSLGKISVLISA